MHGDIHRAHARLITSTKMLFTVHMCTVSKRAHNVIYRACAR